MKAPHPRLMILMLAAAAAVRAQPMSKLSPDEQSLWQAEYAWSEAYVHGDADALTRIELPGYVLTEGDGHAIGRADDVGDIRTGAVHLAEVSLHEAVAHVYGDAAVVTGRVVLRGTENGEPLSSIHAFTDTWVRGQDGQWHAAATQEVRIARGAEASVEPLWRDGGGWLKRHEGFVQAAKKGGVDLLFIGDSITDFWRGATRGKPVWDKYYGSRRAANIGISGDRTQHVLWRLMNGEIDGLNPRGIVLMIGTNNLGLEHDNLTPRGTPAQAADGVAAIIRLLRQKLPDTQILLLGVFPRAHLPTDPNRIQVKQVNEIIRKLDDGSHVHYLDIGDKFLGPDGVLEKDMMPDYLHPTTKGYEIWAQAIQGPLAQIMGW